MTGKQPVTGNPDSDKSSFTLSVKPWEKQTEETDSVSPVAPPQRKDDQRKG